MTVDQMIEEMIMMYGDKLPSPIHSPKVFDYYVRLYKFTKKL